MEITNELSNLDVQLISIIQDDEQPANMMPAILKGQEVTEIIAKVSKTDEVKGLLYVNVMKAGEPDYHGEITSEEEVIKAAHDFLRKGRIKAVDHNHNMQVDTNIDVVESYYDHKTQIWKSVLDISKSEETMQKAKSGKITGVSIYARGVRTPVKKGIFRKAVEFFTIKKAQYSKRSFENAISSKADLLRWSLTEAIWENREDPVKMEADILENISNFTNEIIQTMNSTDLKKISKNKGHDMDVKEATELFKSLMKADREEQASLAANKEKEDLIKSQAAELEKLKTEIVEVKKSIANNDTPIAGDKKEELKKSQENPLFSAIFKEA